MLRSTEILGSGQSGLQTLPPYGCTLPKPRSVQPRGAPALQQNRNAASREMGCFGQVAHQIWPKRSILLLGDQKSRMRRKFLGSETNHNSRVNYNHSNKENSLEP